MSKQKLYVMKGVATSGKSTYAKKISDETGAIILSSDKIATELQVPIKNTGNPIEVFQEMERRATTLFRGGYSVLIDSTNLSSKRIRVWKQFANRFNVPLVCVFVNTLGEQLEENMLKRSQNEWSHFDLETIQQKVHQMMLSMVVPTTIDLIDELIVVQKEIGEDQKQKWRDYFRKNEEIIISHPKEFFMEFLNNGLLVDVFPEFKPILDLNHYFSGTTVFKHCLDVASRLSNQKLELIWAALLHEIGKGCPRVHSYVGRFTSNYYAGMKGNTVPILIKNGEYVFDGKVIPKEHMYSDEKLHYFGYETYSAMLTYQLLSRIGYELHFITKVATIVQFHKKMRMNSTPEEISNYKKTYGESLFHDLQLFMTADYTK